MRAFALGILAGIALTVLAVMLASCGGVDTQGLNDRRVASDADGSHTPVDSGSTPEPATDTGPELVPVQDAEPAPTGCVWPLLTPEWSVVVTPCPDLVHAFCRVYNQRESAYIQRVDCDAEGYRCSHVCDPGL